MYAGTYFELVRVINRRSEPKKLVNEKNKGGCIYLYSRFVMYYNHGAGWNLHVYM